MFYDFYLQECPKGKQAYFKNRTFIYVPIVYIG